VARSTIPAPASALKGINLTDTCWTYIYDILSYNNASNFYTAGSANAVFYHTQASWGGSDNGLYGYERDSSVAGNFSTHYINTVVSCNSIGTGYYDHGNQIADFDGYDVETAHCGIALNITSTCTGTPGICDGDWMLMHGIFDSNGNGCIVVTNVNHGNRPGVTIDHTMCDSSSSNYTTIDIENSVVNFGLGSTLRASGTNNIGVKVNGALSAGTSISRTQFMDIQTGVQILGSATDIAVIGNTFVNSTTTLSATADISIASGSTNIIATGNTFRGYATAGINNAGNGNYLWPNTCAPPNITTCLTDTGTQPADMTNAGVVAKIQGKAVDIPTTKGDLFVYDGTALKRLGLGTDGQVLTAASAQATGINWAAGGGAVGPTYLPYSDAGTCTKLGGSVTTYARFNDHFTGVATAPDPATAIVCAPAPTLAANPPTGGHPEAVVTYGGGGTYYEGQFTIGPMPGWTSGHRVDLHLYMGGDPAATTNMAILIAFGCAHLPVALWTSTFSSFQTLNVSGTAGVLTMATLTGLTVPAACVATDSFLLRVARQQGANGDTTATGDTMWLVGEQILWN
jgi:hypothetical protein